MILLLVGVWALECKHDEVKGLGLMGLDFFGVLLESECINFRRSVVWFALHRRHALSGFLHYLFAA